jgi:hypothetical protein
MTSGPGSTSADSQSHPHVPRVRRLAASDVMTVQRASSLIEELGARLDEELGRESRPGERLRLLRETTNRITRAANDAIHAYARGRASVERELRRAGGDTELARRTRDELRSARVELLRVLAIANSRYPTPEAPSDEDEES